MVQVNTWRCSNCGTLNSTADQFCANCGYSATASANSAAQTIVASSAMRGAPNSQAPRMTGALQIGELIDHRYRIMSAVGKGGFGAVYKARDERFQQRIVALKEMSDAHLSPAEKTAALQDFRHEANLLVPLSHPNLPNVSDIFEEAGKAYLVMEFIEGESLEKIQEDANGPLDEQRVIPWAMQLCSVLQYLHTQPQQIKLMTLL